MALISWGYGPLHSADFAINRLFRGIISGPGNQHSGNTLSADCTCIYRARVSDGDKSVEYKSPLQSLVCILASQGLSTRTVSSPPSIMQHDCPGNLMLHNTLLMLIYTEKSRGDIPCQAPIINNSEGQERSTRNSKHPSTKHQEYTPPVVQHKAPVIQKPRTKHQEIKT